MKLSTVIIMAVLMQFSHIKISTALTCQETVAYYTSYSYKTFYKQRLLTYYQCGHRWIRIRCPSLRFPHFYKIKYRSNKAYRTRSYCCSGYQGSPYNCRAICSQGCYNGGICIRPGTCRCSSGWTGYNCRTPICSQGCYNGGICTRPGICSCHSGWTGYNCTTPYCSQGCYNGGTCTSPSICTCNTGWTGSDCRTDTHECNQDNGGCEHICNNTVGSYECSCRDGYELEFNGRNCTGSTVTFSQLIYSIAEDDGALKPVLVLSKSLSTDVTVQVVVFTDSNDTAIDDDYYSGLYNVTFPAGVTSVSFDISIYDDDIYEDDENFTLTINTDSLPDGIIAGSPNKVIVIMRNNDTECTVLKLDVIFVLDVSKSIKNKRNFALMKNFVKNIADLININLNDSLAGVVLFGSNAWIQFSLTQYTDKNSFQKAVDHIKYKTVKQKGTNTPEVLNLLRIAGQDGRLGLRNDTVKIVVLITDGRPNLNHLNISLDQAAKDTEEAATRLHNSGIYDQVYSVGIEGSKPIGKVLNFIANPPSLIYYVTGFDIALFQQLTQNFTSSFCNDDTQPPQ